MDFYQFLGYFSGLYFIKAEMDSTTLVRTAALVQSLDAILCCVIANHSGRNKPAWTIAGLLGGIWALGILFLLPARNHGNNSKLT